jgi:hypothetical protein
VCADVASAYARALVQACVSSPKGGSVSGSSPHPLAAVAPAAVAAARAKLDSPVFIPQRIWISVALSCSMIAVLALVAFSLTDQLVILLQAAVIELTQLRASLSLTVNEAVATTVAQGNVYLQTVLNGAAGLALAGPQSFFSSQVSQQTLAQFVSGKVNSLVDQVSIAAQVSGGGVAGSAASTAATVAGVSVDAYLQAAITAATDIAGTLPSVAQSYLPAAEGMIQQQLGVQLSAANAESFALSEAQGLLGDVLPSGSASVLNTILAATSPDYWQGLVNRLAFNVRVANITAVVVGASAVAVTWLFLLLSYRRKVLRTRVGEYPFLYKSASIGGASRFIGVQATLAALSFLLTYGIVFVMYVVFTIPGLMSWIWQHSIAFALGFVGVTLVLRIIEQLLVSYLLAFRDRIVFRRLYMLADLWLSFISMAVGGLVAVIRFVPFLPIALLAVMRTDLSPVPLAFEHFDAAKSTYNAAMLQDTQFNHPLKYAFCVFLLDSLRRRREREAAGRHTGSDPAKTVPSGAGAGDDALGSPGPARPFLPSLALTSGRLGFSAAAVLHQKRPSGDGHGDTPDAELGSELVVVRNPIRAPSTTPEHARSSGASAVGGSPSPVAGEAEAKTLTEVTAPSTAVPSYSVSVNPLRSAAAVVVLRDSGREAEVRRQRVRNRWHLAVLLAFNPSLREYRVRDLPLRERQGAMESRVKTVPAYLARLARFASWRRVHVPADRQRDVDGGFVDSVIAAPLASRND